MGVETFRCCMSLRRALAAGTLCALLAGQPAYAELQYGLSLGVGHSDNIERTDINEVDEAFAIAGFDLTWLERTRRLDADVTVNVAYFDYLDNTYEGELVGGANGLVTVGIVPERFTWVFEDTLGQIQTNPFQPSTPETRENINYFTTGPDLTLRFGARTFTRLYGRHSRIDYEESALDAQRNGGGIALARRLGGRNQIALNAMAEKVEFDDVLAEDFERQQAYLSLQVEASRTDIRTQLGYTWLDLEDRRTGGALINIFLSRRLTPSSSIELEFGSRYSDAGEAMRADAVRISGGGDITATADPFESRTATLNWHFSQNRTSLSVGAGIGEEEYEEQVQLNRTYRSYNIHLSRRLSPAIEAGLRAGRTEEKFETAQFRTNESMVAADLTWWIGRTVSVGITLDHITREATGNVGEFDENRAFLILSYRPRGGSFELMRP